MTDEILPGAIGAAVEGDVKPIADYLGGGELSELIDNLTTELEAIRKRIVNLIEIRTQLQTSYEHSDAYLKFDRDWDKWSETNAGAEPKLPDQPQELVNLQRVIAFYLQKIQELETILRK
ncbi:MAG: hypothetical protein LBM73_01900 [Candidatus Nomurabacteria bacterium]|jgi:hypothetical protein|nr:hypothetical protein [Candidatus Nomurabacteria bacterium]